MVFKGADDPIDGANFGRRAAAIDIGELEVAAWGADIEAIRADGVIIAAHKEADIVAGAGEHCAVVGADGSGADDGDGSHGGQDNEGRTEGRVLR